MLSITCDFVSMLNIYKLFGRRGVSCTNDCKTRLIIFFIINFTTSFDLASSYFTSNSYTICFMLFYKYKFMMAFLSKWHTRRDISVFFLSVNKFNNGDDRAHDLRETRVCNTLHRVAFTSLNFKSNHQQHGARIQCGTAEKYRFQWL